MAKASVIEARKAKALQEMAERLTSIEKSQDKILKLLGAKSGNKPGKDEVTEAPKAVEKPKDVEKPKAGKAEPEPAEPK